MFHRLTTRNCPLLRPLLMLVPAALAALAAIVTPATAAAGTTMKRQPAATAEPGTFIATLAPWHTFTNDANLLLKAPVEVTANVVTFNPNVIPTAVTQAPYINLAVPAGTHTYRFIFHLAATSHDSHYRFGNQPPVTLSAHATTVEAVQAVQNNPGWNYWGLYNVDNQVWQFFSCDIYELTG
jgi:hypothetical protein